MNSDYAAPLNAVLPTALSAQIHFCSCDYQSQVSSATAITELRSNSCIWPNGLSRRIFFGGASTCSSTNSTGESIISSIITGVAARVFGLTSSSNTGRSRIASSIVAEVACIAAVDLTSDSLPDTGKSRIPSATEGADAVEEVDNFAFEHTLVATGIRELDCFVAACELAKAGVVEEEGHALECEHAEAEAVGSASSGETVALTSWFPTFSDLLRCCSAEAESNGLARSGAFSGLFSSCSTTWSSSSNFAMCSVANSTVQVIVNDTLGALGLPILPNCRDAS
mmetsp:Transcript_89368/g.177677  ORF Transcript_89368/g.177677 Transcript_89368/m.177677 type:complete len:282 (-) Transcript_89368:2549-3394(-)